MSEFRCNGPKHHNLSASEVLNFPGGMGCPRCFADVHMEDAQELESIQMMQAGDEGEDEDEEPDDNVLGDVFSPAYERKVLFSGTIQIEQSQLKHRKPHVVIEPDLAMEAANEAARQAMCDGDGGLL